MKTQNYKYLMLLTLAMNSCAKTDQTTIVSASAAATQSAKLLIAPSDSGIQIEAKIGETKAATFAFTALEQVGGAEITNKSKADIKGFYTLGDNNDKTSIPYFTATFNLAANNVPCNIATKEITLGHANSIPCPIVAGTQPGTPIVSGSDLQKFQQACIQNGGEFNANKCVDVDTEYDEISIEFGKFYSTEMKVENLARFRELQKSCVSKPNIQTLHANKEQCDCKSSTNFILLWGKAEGIRINGGDVNDLCEVPSTPTTPSEPNSSAVAGPNYWPNFNACSFLKDKGKSKGIEDKNCNCDSNGNISLDETKKDFITACLGLNDFLDAAPSTCTKMGLPNNSFGCNGCPTTDVEYGNLSETEFAIKCLYK